MIRFSIMYELMVVASTKTDSEKFLARVKKILEEASAANLKVERMGKKLLAYPIAKQTEGEYLVFNFEAEPSAVGEITKTLGLEQEAVLRYLLVRAREGKVPKVSEVSEVPKAKVKTKVAVKTKGSKLTKGTKVKVKGKRTKRNIDGK